MEEDWESKYADATGDETWDNLVSYKDIKSILDGLCDPSKSISHMGIGTSALAEDLYDAGCKTQRGYDIAGKVVEIMTGRSKDRSGLVYEKKNLLKDRLPVATADVVIDKGLFDVLMGSSSSEQLAVYLSHVSQHLKSGGHFVVVSYGKPETRESFLSHPRYGWSFAVKTVPKKSHPSVTHDLPDSSAEIYVYLCKKN